MANIQNYHFKCRNVKCGYEGHRAFNIEEFDRLQYGGSVKGIHCFYCGFPKMMIMKSKKAARDKFQPGFQRNIGKYCRTEQEYKKHLKDMGLIEIWYEDIPDSVFESDRKTNLWTDDVIKKFYDNGFNLTSNEIEHLKNLE